MRKPLVNKKEISSEKLEELKMNAKGILSECRRVVMNRYPFFGSIAMGMDIIPIRDERVPTACTDGNDIYFDIDFLRTLTNNERVFVLLHEIGHIVLMHMLRKGTRDHFLFNICSDIEVNNLLAEDGIQTLKDCCTWERYNVPQGLSAEEYYEKLYKEIKQEMKNQNSNGNSGNGNSEGKFSGQFDKHVYKEDSFDNDNSGQNTEDHYGKVGRDPDFQPHMSKNQADKIREAIIGAAQAVERTRGKLPDNIAKMVNEILKPEIDWKEILNQYITKTIGTNITWNRCNKRFVSSRIYMPAHDGESVKLGIIMDTSGSCSNDINKFLSEVNGIVQAYNYDLTIVQCDAEVQDVKTYNNDEPLDLENKNFEVKGFGGTQLTPAFEYFRENHENDIDAIICFTDGECETIDESVTDKPVLWVLTGRDTEAENLTIGQQIFFKN